MISMYLRQCEVRYSEVVGGDWGSVYAYGRECIRARFSPANTRISSRYLAAVSESRESIEGKRNVCYLYVNLEGYLVDEKTDDPKLRCNQWKLFTEPPSHTIKYSNACIHVMTDLIRENQMHNAK